MRNRPLSFLICIVLLFTSFVCICQENYRLSGRYSGIYFRDWIQLVEKTIPVKFYYDTVQLDSIRININADNVPLIELMNTIWKETNYQFSLLPGGRAYISDKRHPIITSLSPDFFIPRKQNETVFTDSIEEDNPVTKRAQISSSEENKLFEIGNRNASQPGSKLTLAGYVRDRKSGEGIVGASVYLDSGSIGVITDQFGYYTLSLPRGRHVLRVSSTGMKATKRQIVIYTNGKLNIDLNEDIPTLKTVVVIAEKNSNVRRMQMGIERLTIKTIKQVPVLLGEPDVLRVILTLPGVTSVGEASTGFNVRGGSTDQNLVLLNDATIFNPSHLFGFFSAFNPDIIKNAELYKSSMPEKFGGRLSSVLDITTRDGNNKTWTGTAGIGLLTTKITLEGPLKKDRTSILLGGRTTYSNWLLRSLTGSEYANSRAYFYDANLHLSHTINSRNNLYLTIYSSSDNFRLNDDTTYRYGNRNIILKWKHVFNNKLYSSLSAGIDNYEYDVRGDKGTIRAYQLLFKIRQYHQRADFTYSPNNKHQFNFGATNIYYKLNPGTLRPTGSQSLLIPETVDAEQAMESALYAGDKITVTDKLSLNIGIRYSLFNYLGPQKAYSYVKGLPRDESTVEDSTSFGSGKTIQTYHGPEFRLALRYSISENTSVKVSYNTLRQYIHLLSNTTAISPTDIWKLSDKHIRPQTGEQYSLGFYRDVKSNTIETSIEFYYRRIRNYLDYKSGATIVLNQHIERDVINTRGRAYGIELLIRKSTGKLNGWISYAYARTELRMDDSLAGQQINKGNYYPANFDKPHSVNLVSNYKFTHRYSISFNMQYSTGRPITLPIAVFNYAGAQRVFYSERNQFRVPDYFRMDFSVNIEGSHNLKKRLHGSWSFGLYNLTARKNPYSIYFIEENGVIKGYKLSVIGTIIPYITYNVRF